MRKAIIHGLKWNTINQIFSLGSKFVVTIVLSRLLSPNDFGILAMIFAFTVVADVLIDSGFKSSIVQERDTTHEELSSIYWLNMTIGFFFTCLIIISSHGLAVFYQEPLVQPLAVGVSFLYIISPSALVHEALLTKELKFKALTISQMASKTASAIAGIYMAYTGWGVWSLVGSVLVGAFLRSFFLWLQCSWRPSFHFRRDDLKKYWKVGSNILYSNILFGLVNRVDYVIIGKFFTPATLGMYSRAKENAFIPGNIIANVIRNTFFGIFSSLKDELVRLRKLYIDASNIILIVLTIIFSLIIIYAKELILILFGEQWMDMELMFQYSCIYVFMYCNTILRVYLLNALGRTDIDFRAGLFAHPLRLGVLLIPFLIDVHFDPYYFIWVNTFFVLVAIFIYEFHIHKILNLAYQETFRFLPLLVGFIIVTLLIVSFVSFDSMLTTMLVKAFSIGIGSIVILGVYYKQLKPLVRLVITKDV